MKHVIVTNDVFNNLSKNKDLESNVRNLGVEFNKGLLRSLDSMKNHKCLQKSDGTNKEMCKNPATVTI